MLKSINAEMLATDRALDMARDGMPFREAYRTAVAQGADISAETIAQSLANRRLSQQPIFGGHGTRLAANMPSARQASA